jgi:hypothetical protein
VNANGKRYDAIAEEVREKIVSGVERDGDG